MIGRHAPQRRSGYTLLEMIIVVVIVALTMSMITTILLNSQRVFSDGVRIESAQAMASQLLNEIAAELRDASMATLKDMSSIPPNDSNSIQFQKVIAVGATPTLSRVIVYQHTLYSAAECNKILIPTAGLNKFGMVIRKEYISFPTNEDLSKRITKGHFIINDKRTVYPPITPTPTQAPFMGFSVTRCKADGTYDAAGKNVKISVSVQKFDSNGKYSLYTASTMVCPLSQ